MLMSERVSSYGARDCAQSIMQLRCTFSPLDVQVLLLEQRRTTVLRQRCMLSCTQ